MVIFCQRPRWCRSLFCHGLRLRGGRCRWDLQISFSKWPLVDGLVGCFKNFSFTFNSLLSVKPSSQATYIHCVSFMWCISIILGGRYTSWCGTIFVSWSTCPRMALGRWFVWAKGCSSQQSKSPTAVSLFRWRSGTSKIVERLRWSTITNGLSGLIVEMLP